MRALEEFVPAKTMLDMEKPTLQAHVEAILSQRGAYSSSFLRDAISAAREARRWRDYYKTVDKELDAIKFKLGYLAAEHEELLPAFENIVKIIDELRRYPFTEQESYSLLK